MESKALLWFSVGVSVLIHGVPGSGYFHFIGICPELDLLMDHAHNVDDILSSLQLRRVVTSTFPKHREADFDLGWVFSMKCQENASVIRGRTF